MTKEELLKKAYVERDISWMYFNHRILQEAEKEYVPLLERLSFSVFIPITLTSSSVSAWHHSTACSTRSSTRIPNSRLRNHLKQLINSMNLIRKNTLRRWIRFSESLKYTRFACSTKTNSTTSRRNSLRSSSTTSSMVLSTLSGSMR